MPVASSDVRARTTWCPGSYSKNAIAERMQNNARGLSEGIRPFGVVPSLTTIRPRWARTRGPWAPEGTRRHPRVPRHGTSKPTSTGMEAMGSSSATSDLKRKRKSGHNWTAKTWTRWRWDFLDLLDGRTRSSSENLFLFRGFNRATTFFATTYPTESSLCLRFPFFCRWHLHSLSRSPFSYSKFYPTEWNRKEILTNRKNFHRRFALHRVRDLLIEANQVELNEKFSAYQTIHSRLEKTSRHFEKKLDCFTFIWA